jgi:hypothetical protein
MWLIYMMISIAVVCMTVSFWWKVIRWAILHGRETHNRVMKFKDAVSCAMTSGPAREE